MLARAACQPVETRRTALHLSAQVLAQRDISALLGVSHQAVSQLLATDGARVRELFSQVRVGMWMPLPSTVSLIQPTLEAFRLSACASPGNCAAGGDYYTDASGRQQAFVVSEKNGSWGTAREVAGALNIGGEARVASVSCASAGNCSAGGGYKGGSDNYQAFVISEVDGTWATAREVAGSLNINGAASVTSVSCASAGGCSAGGTYDYGGYNAAFVVSEKNGIWGQAIDVPGLSAVARDAYLSSVSCASAGNCVAGGYYQETGRYALQGFVT